MCRSIFENVLVMILSLNVILSYDSCISFATSNFLFEICLFPIYMFPIVLPISPSNCPNTKFKEAVQIVDWLTSQDGKETINEFKLNGSDNAVRKSK